jgi:hypothetical protein
VTIIDTFSGGSESEILITCSAATMGLLRKNGDAVWSLPLITAGLQDGVMAGVADMNGDGALDVVVVGQCNSGDSVVSYDAATGIPQWTLALPALCSDSTRPTGVATTDLDGDGEPQIVLNTHSGHLLVLTKGPFP